MSSDGQDAPKPGRARSSAGVAANPGYKQSLVLHTDGINTSVNWRLADYEEKGALSDENIAKLAERFGLSRFILERLSLYVGNSLDDESLVNLTKMKGSVAVARANRALADAVRLAQRVEQDLGKIIALVEPLSDDLALHEEQKEALRNAKEKTRAAQRAAAGLHNVIDQLIALPGSAAEIAPTDKRRIRDGRRVCVVESCCYAWSEAGRKVTYTTRPDRLTDQRGGPLIEFIQAVVMMVTDPPSRLSGETIRKDIEQWEPDDVPDDPVSIKSKAD